ncbi:PaaI family thioesterase [Caldimonas thermodepolymerans]|jgi:uncharacterized domain 1|uniref:PaaI family thioesterase n=1 Tax=Caldimonas thermodepolymerans TaxID=215580 RepID=A0A2S5T6L5_9BURK|nr:PaaI family thioesterase [Caldimonas thermodepolymerans]PPE70621.1 PaaI family thioesterase [Caldimonas thermodepolymerans]QPC29998.1 PaaI family thioesterase [Caldimonas thermodepolymerans]RDH97620.1 uncharacterized protein (TIGR00369 family) [Caldimonas thermodepolymerans]TCP10033.1 uncharacterized protein (TIGR00369 family) [Caldimonas thermodepolymerans]UZG42743.1 PaaI family thioesterase [Caldimonas thermodepolymerans]
MMQFPVHIPFIQALGVELVRIDEGEAELRVALQEMHRNSFGVAHGGVIMTLLDVAMAHAARSIHRDRPDFGPGVVTVEMKTSFMRPGEGELRAVGRLLHRTATLAFCDGEIFNATGERLAHATGTFKYLRALPSEGRGIKPLQRRLEGSGSD